MDLVFKRKRVREVQNEFEFDGDTYRYYVDVSDAYLCMTVRIYRAYYTIERLVETSAIVTVSNDRKTVLSVEGYGIDRGFAKDAALSILAKNAKKK